VWTNYSGAAAAACGELGRSGVVCSDWRLSQHWLLYEGVVGGGVAAEKYARRQSIALKIYAGKHPTQIMEASRRQQGHFVRSLNVSL
jgi:hypothetical protein